MALSEKLKPLWGLAEKVLATYVQAFVVALIGSSFFESLDWSVAQSAAIATVPAAITVLVNATQSAMIPTSWPYLVQVVMRTLRTGVAAFGGYLIAVPTFELSMSLASAAWASAGVAVLAALKAELGRFVGDPGTVAWLPERVDTGPVGGLGDGARPGD